MAYEPKTTRVELEPGKGVNPFKKGAWAVLYEPLLHGTQRAVNHLTRPFLNYEGGAALGLDNDRKPELKGGGQVTIDLTRVDFDQVNDAIILGQVKEWSFGPVDQATLDAIPEDLRAVLVAKCDELYGAAGPLAEGGGGN